jgi:hypothetical protein
MRITLSILIIFTVSFFPVLSRADSQTAFDVLVISESYEVTGTLQNIISFYQEHISPYNGARCMFAPTCSQFYKEALRHYGFFWGTLMTVDRLFFREGQSSMKYYRYLEKQGRYRDPVYHNYIFNRMDYYK